MCRVRGGSLPLTSKTIILVGSYFKGLYRNCMEPTTTLAFVVEGRGVSNIEKASRNATEWSKSSQWELGKACTATL